MRDYAIVAKLPGPSKNTIMIFASTHDTGQISVIKTFTSASQLKELDSLFKSPENDRFFQAVYEVQGFERTGFHPTLLHFNKIASDLEIISPSN